MPIYMFVNYFEMPILNVVTNETIVSALTQTRMSVHLNRLVLSSCFKYGKRQTIVSLNRYFK